MIASLAIVLALFQAVASCPFADKAHGSLRAAPNDEVHRKLKSATFITDRELFPTCSLGATVTSEANIRAVYTGVRKELYALLKRSHQFARSNIFGAALRLAFHDAGEIDLNSTDKLGPDGCLSNTVANSGLLEANTVLMTVFEPMWQKYCDRISRADFWALLGKMAAEAADPTHTLNVPFQYGRKDNAQCDGGADRLPMHQPGIPEFERVFIRQMGLTMHDAVALLGAHTVGHVHPQFSGFGAPDDPEWLKMRFSDNAWDETPESFDHQYYRSMLLETWRNDVNNDRPTLNTWFVAKATDTREVEPEEGPTTFVYNTLAAGNAPIEGAIAVAATADAANTAVTNPGAAEPGAAEGAGGIGLDRRRMQELGSMRNFLHINTIMLNADMALAFPIHTDQNPDNQAFTGVDEETCGVVLGPNGKAGCKSSKYGVVSGEVPTFAQVKAYSENNALFLEDFAAAYAKMTTVGYSLDAAPAGKLGSLTSVDLGNYWAEPVPFAHAPTPFSASNPYSPSQSFLKSPYGEYEDICPEYDGATYYVDGWPGTPYKITPFVNAFANPIPAVPTHTECREDGHCMSSFEMDVLEIKARPWDRAVPMCKNFPATTFMSYNGSLPGPTITMPSGHESIVRFNNKIRVTEEYDRKFKPCKGNRTGRPYSVHFHGSASLAPFDGWADDETCFGESKDYVYPNNRPNTGWYHDHGAHITADNAYDGMAGFYIISSKQKHGGIGEPYGLEDMEEKLMVLGDKLLDDTCQLRMQPKSVHERSFYGDINTVNGIPYPVMTIEPKWIRFRLLSAAVARPYKVRIKTAEDNKDVSKDICYVIASDGGYRHEPAPFPRAGLFMGVGERYEVVCDFSQLGGKTLIMWNEKDFSQMKDVPYYCYSHLVMKINVLPALLTAQTPAVFDAAALPADSIVPIKQVLTEQDYQKALAMAENGDYHRRMDFGRRWGMWVINGETWTSFKIAADDIGQNTWEVWLLRTGGGWFHPIHLHLVDFYVLRRDGGNGVEEYEKKVAKDVVELGPSNNVYVLARFGAHRGDYMFHCHNLIHEDADMLRAFHMVSSEHGKTASTAEKYVQNPLNGIIYSNYKYADPMFGETEAKPIGTRPPITVDYVRHTLELNLYRIFYPLPADKELYANLSNPWETQWRSLLPEPWGQCGGKGWTGPTSCHAGYDCSYVSEWYSQCVPGTPPPGQQAAWGQCGGNGYSGPTVCVYGFSCVAQSEWYSQCVPSSTKNTVAPTQQPSTAPTAVPTALPTVAPTVKPTAKPTAKVTAKPTTKASAAPTPKATAKPTTKATAAPSTAPATAQAAWGQCGGQGWTGPTTCVAGYQCVYDSQWYSQCKPVAAGANEQAAWGQCGGEGWTGLTQCSAGYTCVYQSQWYSQCKPVARHMRGRA